MSLNDIKFFKQNGGMGRQAASQDPVSGLILSIPALATIGLDDLASKLEVVLVDDVATYVAKIKYYEQLADLGITKQVIDDNVLQDVAITNAKLRGIMTLNMIDYHIREFFRMSPEGEIYLMLADTDVSGSHIKQLQYYATGTIRQIGILNKTISDELIEEYQEAATGDGVLDGLEQEHQPLSILVGYCGGYDIATLAVVEDKNIVELTSTTEVVKELDDFKTDIYVKDGRCNVSLVISCDLSANNVRDLGCYSYYSAIGTLLGAVSNASVNECIAWVQKFPLGFDIPAFISGDLLKNVTTVNLNLINDNKYIFVRRHVGNADCYFNDSFTLDVATSDYAYIENVRTIDKATRGIRTNVLPYLNAPLQVDADTGNMRSFVVSNLETVAGKALEDMEKAGELSGYIVLIDPAQNVLSTSTVEIVIKKVGVGVMRNVRIKIGYTTSL
jgi:hypothetical protein